MAFDDLPSELKSVARWICWKAVVKDGRPTKLPVSSKTLQVCDITDERNWSTYQGALACFDGHRDSLSGLGFVLGSGYVGVDIDIHLERCDSDTQKEEYRKKSFDMVKDFFDNLKTYTEISQSGKGYHFIFKGVLPVGMRHNSFGPTKNGPAYDCEMYDSLRFFVMTGNVKRALPIIDGTEAIKPLFARYMVNEPRHAVAQERSPMTFSSVGDGSNDKSWETDDDALIEKIRESAQGAKFSALFDGGWESIQPDHSRADMILACILAFWTKKDKTRMERLFRRSALMRDKFDRKDGTLDGAPATYGEKLLDTACAQVTKVVGEDSIKREPMSKSAIILPSESYVDDDESAPVAIDPSTGLPYPDDSELYDNTDTGNAWRFYDYCNHGVHWNHDNNAFMLWDGMSWGEDKKGKIKERVNDMLLVYKKEIESDKKRLDNIAPNDSHRKELEDRVSAEKKNYIRLSNNSGKNAMLEELKPLMDVPVTNDDLDKDLNLINTPNGIIDLDTGELNNHDISKNMTMITGVPYDPSVSASRWMEFLNQVFVKPDGITPDPSLIDFVQKIVGYSLIGGNKERKMFIFVGEGSNGKGVFLDTIMSMLGSYATSIRIDVLLDNNGGTSQSSVFSLAMTKGKRFVRSSEPGERSKFNEGLIKELTGKNPVSASRKYGNDFSFIPDFKMFLEVNRLPAIYGTDRGIWSRICPIPFNATFLDRDLAVNPVPNAKYMDKNLEEKLRPELPGILAWAVEGCMKYRTQGLEMPEQVVSTFNNYKQQSDIINDFVTDECIVGDGFVASLKQLFSDYMYWAKETNSKYTLSRADFSKELKKKFDAKRTGNGVVFTGLQLSNVNKDEYDAL